MSSADAPSGGGPTKTEMDFEPGATEERARPFLFLVLEADRPLAGGARFALEAVDELLVGRSDGPPRQVTRAIVGGTRRLTLRALGQFLSKDHALFRREGQGWVVQDLNSRNGVFVNGSQIEGAASIGPGDLVSLGRLFFLFEVDETEQVADLDASALEATGPVGFATLIPSLAKKLARLRQEASRKTSITLVGETGTGKEVLARAIHAISGRSGPYLAVNCGAIPKDLIQSELFGHVKGAFSGATEARGGYLRDAHQGTLLLDEIVAAPAPVQIALLRAIQEKAATPVGSTKPVPVDVRFIAAAQKPLGDAVEDGTFREDLQARLEAFVFELPPLRERLEDLGILVASTLRANGVTEKDNPRFSWRAASRLLRYEWPRNIRELAQAIDVAWGGARTGEIDEADLPKPKVEEVSPRSRLKQQLVAHLRAARGNVAEVARKMGRTRPLVYHYLKKFELDPESFR